MLISSRTPTAYQTTISTTTRSWSYIVPTRNTSTSLFLWVSLLISCGRRQCWQLTSEHCLAGVKKWFISCKIPAHQVVELDWHQEALVKIPRSVSSYSDNGYPPRASMATESDDEAAPLTGGAGDGDHYDDQHFGKSAGGAALTLKVICTPAQHRSGRGIFDHFSSLWSSWVVGVVNRGDNEDDPFEDEALEDRDSERRFRPEDGFRMYFAG